jgi:hypothetical protein
VGKTRLITEMIAQAPALGAVTLAGGCLDIGDGVLAYTPLVEALRSLTALLDAAELDRVLGGSRAELARLVPELGPPVAEADPAAPARLFELLLGGAAAPDRTWSGPAGRGGPAAPAAGQPACCGATATRTSRPGSAAT